MTDEHVLSRYRMEILIAGILLLSAFLNIWNIWNQGYSNTYYAAAVKSMLANPGVLFFNSFDAGGFVTVDKPPAGLWIQAASAVIFGFSGWALVLPQALAGVGSVALIYCIVSRPFGKPAGLIAAFALAVTPIFVAVSRNETPDGLLIFVILLAVWTAIRAARENSLPCLLLAVTLVGIGFNIKMIQAFIVVPAVLAVYLLGAGGVPVKKRLLHIILAIALLGVISLSWAVIVDSVPADQRPYIGGSGDNTVMGLIVNYNGIHRLENNGASGPGGNGGPQMGAEGMQPGQAFSRNQTADLRVYGMKPDAGGASPQGMPVPPGSTTTIQTGLQGTPSSSMPDRNQTADIRESRMAPDGISNQQGNFPSGNGQGETAGPGAPGGRTGGGMDDTGSPGILRLFGSGLFGQITWLLLFALIGLLAWIRKPAEWSLKGVEDAGYFSERGMVLLAMCLWLFPGLTYFSFTTGFWHTYYLATIAPPLAALAGIGAWGMYRAYSEAGGKGWLLISAVLITGLTEVVFLLSSTLEWSGILVPVLANSLIIITVVLAVLILKNRTSTGHLPKIMVAVAIGLLFVAPFIWACTPLAYSSGNFLPVAGPQLARSNGGGPGGNGSIGSSGSDSGLADYLISHKTNERWLVAVSGSNEASGLILSTGEPVMALGGFSGSDQILTTSALSCMLQEGQIRYFYTSSSSGDNRGGSSGNAAIFSWVSSHCTIIPASEYSTKDSGTSTGEPGILGNGQMGSRTLYDCRNATG
jgi:4-amino-4-deoxy-L-arabinose transferase-like glycosyltransferase